MSETTTNNWETGKEVGPSKHLTVIPLSRTQNALPVIGHLRLGEKGDADYPSKASTLIFTFLNRADAEATANKLGGEVTGYKSSGDLSADNWKVVTGATEATVVLPGANAIIACEFQKQVGRATERRCDGELCQFKAADGNGWMIVDCLCNETGMKECKPNLRAQIILPWCSLGAVIVTSQAHEAVTKWRAAVDLISGLSGAGWPGAVLSLEQAKNSKGSWPWPKIRPVGGGPSFAELQAAADDRVAALAAGGAAADSWELGEGDDDDVVDAEIVDDPQPPSFRARLREAASEFNKRNVDVVNGTDLALWCDARSFDEIQKVDALSAIVALSDDSWEPR